MRERFVFISHGAEDKPKVSGFVRALIARGEKIWVDNPPALGLSLEEIEAHCFRLSAGNRWKDDLELALQRAGCVLLLATGRIYEQRRKVWRREAIVAQNARTLVAARLERFSFDTESDLDLSQEQLADLTPEAQGSLETRLDLLLDDVQRKLDVQTRVVLSGAAPEGSRRRSALGPYLIDRSQQEREFRDALQVLAEADGVRAFLVAGPENEALEPFRERLRKHTCPGCLPNEAAWEELDVEWPVGERPADFGSAYLHGLRAGLPAERRIGAEATLAELGRALADYGKPVAVFSQLSPTGWGRDEAKRLRAWLKLWGALGAISGVKAAPVLQLSLPEAKPGWKRHFDDPRKGAKECPPGGEPQAQPNRAIWNCALAVEKRPGNGKRDTVLAPFAVLPMLHPVRARDVEPWLRLLAPEGIVESPWAMDLREWAKTLFTEGKAKRFGLAHEQFAMEVMPKFRQG